MHEVKTYGTIISDKFRDFSYPDMDTMWPDMKDILDKEMPQKKKRRLAFWNWRSLSIFALLGAGILSIALYIFRNPQQDQVSGDQNHC